MTDNRWPFQGQPQGSSAEAEAWRRRASDLADWAGRRLVNRRDAYGAYTPVEVRGTSGRDGRPVPATYTAKQPLSAGVLRRHFLARQSHHVIGLHSTSPEQTCLWGAFDVDRHLEETDPGETLATALRLQEGCWQCGLTPLLTTSNGSGGYHLRFVFRNPVPCRDLYHLLQTIAEVHDFRGEFFPKQPAIKAGGFGNWLRLPGRHHTRDHWSRVWNRSRWLSGEDAVAYLLAFEGDDGDVVPPAPPPPTPPPTPRRLRQFGDGSAGSLERRIASYAARLPNKSAGQGRDDVAYHFACFLVRDLDLPDAEALAWLSGWDAANQPPKGEKRLQEIITSAHQYGRSAYGAGLERGP